MSAWAEAGSAAYLATDAALRAHVAQMWQDLNAELGRSRLHPGQRGPLEHLRKAGLLYPVATPEAPTGWCTAAPTGSNSDPDGPRHVVADLPIGAEAVWPPA